MKNFLAAQLSNRQQGETLREQKMVEETRTPNR
jgi:hypothetical protein